MKIKVVRTSGDEGLIEEIEAQEVRVRVGKKTIILAVHPAVDGLSEWVVTVPECGARIAWGIAKKEAVEAAKKKILAIGYAKYWEAVRDHQRRVLGGKAPDRAKRVSVAGYKRGRGSKLSKDLIRRLDAAGARQGWA